MGECDLLPPLPLGWLRRRCSPPLPRCYPDRPWNTISKFWWSCRLADAPVSIWFHRLQLYCQPGVVTNSISHSQGSNAGCLGPLKSVVSAQHALQRSATETRKLLGGTEQNIVLPNEESMICTLQANHFSKKQTGKIEFVDKPAVKEERLQLGLEIRPALKCCHVVKLWVVVTLGGKEVYGPCGQVLNVASRDLVFRLASELAMQDRREVGSCSSRYGY